MLLDLKLVARDAFGVTPDTRFLYMSRSHQEALDQLFHGIDGDRPFAVLTGDPGTGKTTLLFHLLEHYRRTAQTVFVFQTQCTARDLMRYVLADCDIDCPEDDLPAMHGEFNRLLVSTHRAGKRFLLLLDEAQSLTEDTLEAVRLLSDFETPKKKLLQIVFSGQPSLEQVLMRPAMLQLRQRVAVYCSLQALTREETDGYIAHRLKVVGRSEELFSRTSLRMIFDLTRGIPREIHNVCFESLCLAQSHNAPQVDCEMVRESAKRLRMALPEGSYVEQPMVSAATAAACASDQQQEPAVASVSASSSFIGVSPRIPEATFAPVPETSFASMVLPSEANQRRTEHPPADPDVDRFRYLFEPAKDRPLEKRPAPKAPPPSTHRGVVLASGCAIILSAVVVFAAWGDVAGLKSKLRSVAEARVQPAAPEIPPDATAPKPVSVPTRSQSKPYGKSVSKAASTRAPEIAADGSSRVTGSAAVDSDAAPNTTVDLSQLASREQAIQLLPTVIEPATKARLNAPAQPAISEVVPSKLIVSPPPVYPEDARRAGVYGVVELDAVIDTQGKLKNIRLVKGHPLLVREAIKAAERQQYTPFLLNSVPQEAPTRIRFVFKP